MDTTYYLGNALKNTCTYYFKHLRSAKNIKHHYTTQVVHANSVCKLGDVTQSEWDKVQFSSARDKILFIIQFTATHPCAYYLNRTKSAEQREKLMEHY